MPHVLAFTIGASLIRLAVAPCARRGSHGGGAAHAGVRWLADHTLEIYLVHEYVLKSPQVSGLRFPLNLVAFWALTIPLAGLTKLAASVGRRTGQFSDAEPLPTGVGSALPGDRGRA